MGKKSSSARKKPPAKKSTKATPKKKPKKKRAPKSKQRVTRARVVAELHAEDYRKAAKLGKAALPHLRAIVEGDDWVLATKAVYLSGLLNEDESVPIIEQAAKSRRPALRIAAASAAAHLDPERAEPVLKRLLKSGVMGICKWAIRAVASAGTDELFEIVDELRRKDEDAELQALARETLKSRNS